MPAAIFIGVPTAETFFLYSHWLVILFLQDQKKKAMGSVVAWLFACALCPQPARNPGVLSSLSLQSTGKIDRSACCGS
jgi:hypothetical protein